MHSRQNDRRSRNIVLGALLILFVLYFVKFTYPQHTIQGAIIKHTSSGTSQEAIPQSKDVGKGAAAASKTAAAKKTKPTKAPTPNPDAEPSPSFNGSGNVIIIDKVAVMI